MSDSYDITLIVTNLTTGANTNEKIRIPTVRGGDDAEYITRTVKDLGERSAAYFGKAREQATS